VRPPGRPGRVVTEMIEGCLDGATRALYVVGENPLLSEPDLHHAEKAIDQLDVLVVQDLFMHETAERAHVFLPAAAFAEKEGTFTNSERRVQRVRQALPPPGEARPDWWIACELAKRVARRLGIDVGGQFDYPGPAEIPRFSPASRTRVSTARGASSGRARPRITPARGTSTRSPFRRGAPGSSRRGRPPRPRSFPTAISRSSSTPAASSTTGTAGPSPDGSRACSSSRRTSKSPSIRATRGGSA